MDTEQNKQPREVGYSLRAYGKRASARVEFRANGVKEAREVLESLLKELSRISEQPPADTPPE